MSLANLLQQLKTPTVRSSSPSEATDLYFQLKVHPTKGGFLQILGADQKPLGYDPDYTLYTGVTRQLLKNLSYLSADKSSFWDVGWGEEANTSEVWLDHHPILFSYLKDCPNFINQQGKPIQFAAEPATLKLQITQQEGQATTQIQLHPPQSHPLPTFKMIAEGWVYAKGILYEVKPIGENAFRLPLFNTSMPEGELSVFLSLFFSTFTNIELEYEQYLVQWKEDTLARAALFFDRIDAFDSLYLRVATHLPHLNPEVLGNFTLSVSAQIQPLEQTIFLQNLVYESVEQPRKELEKMLKQAQRSIKDEAESGYVVEDDTFIIEKKLAQAFIYRHLTTLIGRFAIFGAERLKSYKVRPVTPRLDLNLHSGINFLEGTARLDLEGESFSLFDAIQQLQRKGYVQLSDGTHALVNQAYVRRLERLFKKQKEDQIQISFFDLPLVADLIEERILNERMPEAMMVYEGFNTLQARKTALPNLQGALRPYQRYGVEWMTYLHENNLGGCLADDMGLGKTIQTIGLLSTLYPQTQTPSLIVMPTSLLFNWEAELKKFNPTLSAYTYYGLNRDLTAAYQHDLILTTYGMLRSDIELFKEKPFYYVILDESQNIKNLESQASKAVMLLQAKHRLALSGTPIENHLGELYALFRFLNPGMFGSAEDFSTRYATPIQKQNDEEVAAELRKKIYPFILRRLKRDVAKELPERVEQALIVEMSPEQARYYESRRAYYQDSIHKQVETQGIQKSQFMILQALGELRQIAAIPEAQTDGRILSPKRELLMEQVLDATANGHKVLIFTNFLAAVEAIGEDLQTAGIPFVSMTGATTNRRELVQKFQEDKHLQVFLMTLKTGGVGLNLTAADHVFIFDPWWNTAAESQAIDRTHRIGQDKTVFSYKLIAKGSIEEKILQLQEQKRALFDAIISSDAASLKSLSTEDIAFILGA